VSNAELLSLWYWLVATGHSGITLNNGAITLDSNSDSLASGSSTTSAGRAYLLNLMNLREASAAEVTRAKEGGTPGVTNQFTPTFQVGPGERPVKVNEYGFETSNNNNFWVIPTN
jgi:X-X-X-Leu-X-X-Gly heptad repeat protein